MLGVILGAGASYDCFEELPAPRPPDPEPPDDLRSAGLVLHRDRADLDLGLDIERLPLANQLFDGRESFSSVVEQYPEVRSIAARLQRTTNLEAELDLIAEEGADDPQVGCQLVAMRFYLRSVIAVAQRSLAEETHGVDNYHTLLDEIRKWQLRTDSEVCFITFNYDTLLEEACADSFAEFEQTSDLDWYVDSHPKVRVYKPHGSITWGQKVTTTSRTDEASLIKQGWQLQPGDQFQLRSTRAHTAEFALVGSSPAASSCPALSGQAKPIRHATTTQANVGTRSQQNDVGPNCGLARN